MAAEPRLKIAGARGLYLKQVEAMLDWGKNAIWYIKMNRVLF